MVRKDLNMGRGKTASQVAHASMKVFFDRMIYSHPGSEDTQNDQMYSCNFTPEMRYWVDNSFTKICVGVDSEEKIIHLHAQAEMDGIPCALITDKGVTQFRGVPTVTCLAIGPADSDKIDSITGDLHLL